MLKSARARLAPSFDVIEVGEVGPQVGTRPYLLRWVRWVQAPLGGVPTCTWLTSVHLGSGGS
jgi:hypothetical protein